MYRRGIYHPESVANITYLVTTRIQIRFQRIEIMAGKILVSFNIVGKSVTSGERYIVLMRPWSGETGREVG